MGYTMFPYSYWKKQPGAKILHQSGQDTPCDLGYGLEFGANQSSFLFFCMLTGWTMIGTGILGFVIGGTYQYYAASNKTKLLKDSQDTMNATDLIRNLDALQNAASRGTLANILTVIIGVVIVIFSTWARMDLAKVFSEICAQNLKKRTCVEEDISNEHQFSSVQQGAADFILIAWVTVFVLMRLGILVKTYADLQSDITSQSAYSTYINKMSGGITDFITAIYANT